MCRNNIALCFDFDGTLCSGNMQEYGLLQDLGYRTTNEFYNFWQKRIEGIWQTH